ncbi:MAG TPA: STAS domain-containing protein [Xanthobacteraceae bacterium]|nr:STAS domain-containing protein [Xanthobacteraceae bacterium]
MDISVEDVDGITRVVLQGRLDTAAAVMMELPLNTVAAEKKAIMVDLSSVSFLSSYALRLLLMGAKIAQSKGGKLVLVCPDNNVAKVLRSAGASDLIPVVPDGGAAIAALAAIA